MLFTVDLGNTHTHFGLIDDENFIISERVSTNKHSTGFELSVLIRSMFVMRGIDPENIDGAIIGSVVPSLTPKMKEAIKKTTGVDALIVGPGVKSGLSIRLDDSKQLGADLVAASVGGIAYYGAPLIIVDLGSATTLAVIDKNNQYIGGSIAPGAELSVHALSNGASQLPSISLEVPDKVIAVNTIQSMRSGAVYGHAAMIDGMIDRVVAELGYEASCVATGGLSDLIIPCCRHKITIDRQLMIKGLKEIYLKNKKSKKLKESR